MSNWLGRLAQDAVSTVDAYVHLWTKLLELLFDALQKAVDRLADYAAAWHDGYGRWSRRTHPRLQRFFHLD